MVEKLCPPDGENRKKKLRVGLIAVFPTVGNGGTAAVKGHFLYDLGAFCDGSANMIPAVVPNGSVFFHVPGNAEGLGGLLRIDSKHTQGIKHRIGGF